jgi:signal transduction histidine kinase/ActR/RegA family two-component response regulator
MHITNRLLVVCFITFLFFPTEQNAATFGGSKANNFFTRANTSFATQEVIAPNINNNSTSKTDNKISINLGLAFLLAILVGNFIVLTLFIKKVKVKNSEIERANNQLKHTNKHLSAIVDARTHEMKKALKKAEESDRLKTLFLTNMSHDVRTPLNGIIGFTRLLYDDSLTPKTRKYYLDIISKRGQNLLRLINDILNISQLEAGKIEIKRRSCNVNLLLNDLYTIFSSEEFGVKKAEVQLRVITSLNDSRATTITDPLRLEQVLSNLIDNALKFTEKGVVEFGYKLDKDFLIFYVSDTGVGIDSKHFEKLFERFSKVFPEESEPNYPLEGSGLGLYIAKSIVELLDGKIWFESQPKQGSTFYFTIPYVPQKVSSVKHISKSMVATSTIDLTGKVILVVEDDYISYQLIENLLEKTGAKLIHVKNGEDAVEVVKLTSSIDLVLMDMQLPFLSGYEATVQIKQIKPQIPIVAQTAHAMDNDKERCLKAGCNNYLPKPIDPDEFILTIGEYLFKETSIKL